MVTAHSVLQLFAVSDILVWIATSLQYVKAPQGAAAVAALPQPMRAMKNLPHCINDEIFRLSAPSVLCRPPPVRFLSENELTTLDEDVFAGLTEVFEM